MQPQEFVDKMNAISETLKKIYEDQKTTFEEFLKEHEIDKEYPVVADEKQKWVRVYNPDGFFVYNKKYEMGLRAKPVNPA